MAELFDVDAYSKPQAIMPEGGIPWSESESLPEGTKDEPPRGPAPEQAECTEEEPSQVPAPEWLELSKKAQKCVKDLKAKGLNYSERVIRQFLGAMFTNTNTNYIIVLSGPPGTGKSSLPRAIADWLKENPLALAAKWSGAECRMVSVQPSWTDNQDLLGFYDPTRDRFAATAFLDILVEAREKQGTIFLICLDEMNLVRVEYYFSEILSAMENSKTLRLYSPFAWKQQDDALTEQIQSLEKLILLLGGVEQLEASEKRNAAVRAREALRRYPAEFELPENVWFVGTLNMDETTRELSPKVLDRSFIIEVGGTGPAAGGEEIPGTLEQRLSGLEELQTALSELENKHRNHKVRAALSARGMAHAEKLLEAGLDLDDIFLGKVLPAMRCRGVTLEELTASPMLAKYRDVLECYYNANNAHPELVYWRR